MILIFAAVFPNEFFSKFFQISAEQMNNIFSFLCEPLFNFFLKYDFNKIQVNYAYKANLESIINYFFLH